MFDLRAIEDQLERNPAGLVAAAVRAVHAEHYVGSTPTRSELEERFLALSRSIGAPDPEVNVWLALPGTEHPFLIDFLYRAERVAVETDGDRFHLTKQAFERDRRRDQLLTLHGWRPVRTTWKQVVRRPDELAPTLRALLRQ